LNRIQIIIQKGVFRLLELKVYYTTIVYLSYSLEYRSL